MTMSNRYEIKYLISEKEYDIISRRLKYFLKSDTHYEKSSYKVSNIYFDDYNNQALFQKLEGLENRKKYRIRYYDDDLSFIRFECKIKENQMVRKESMVIDENDYRKLLSGQMSKEPVNHGLLNGNLISYFFLHRFLFKPVLIVDYDREAYNFGLSDIRITIDKKLKYGDVNSLVRLPYYHQPVYILEIKYQRFLPSFIKNLLQLTSCEQLAISKYTMCRLAKNRVAI